MQQRGGTCYMASATLVFARGALDACKHAEIRHFVRRSMGHAYDDAMGFSWEHTCPRMPKVLRQTYANALEKFTARTRGTVMVYTQKSLDCARDSTCTEKALLRGGQAGRFLVSLLLAADMPCVFTMLWCPMNELRMFIEQPPELRNLGPVGYGDKVVRGLRATAAAQGVCAAFHLVEMQMVWSGLTIDEVDLLERLLSAMHRRASKDRMRVEGATIAVSNKNDPTRAHAIATFPCTASLLSGELKWICCNSWRKTCSRDGLAPCMKEMHSMLGVTHIQAFTVLIRDLRCGTKPKKGGG